VDKVFSGEAVKLLCNEICDSRELIAQKKQDLIFSEVESIKFEKSRDLFGCQGSI